MSRTEEPKEKVQMDRLDSELRLYYDDYQTSISNLRVKFCDELHYNSEYIKQKASAIKSFYPIEKITDMCNALNVRYDYITGKDDYRTEFDRISDFSKTDKLALEITLRYFKLLGYNIKFNIYTNLYPVTLYKLHQKGLLQGYINNTTYQEIIKTFDFSLPSAMAFQQKYAEYMTIRLKIELLKPFDEHIVDFEDIGLYTDAPSKIINSLHADESVIKQNIDYYIFAYITKDNEEISMSIKDFLDIAQALNNMSTCFIDNALKLRKNAPL